MAAIRGLIVALAAALLTLPVAGADWAHGRGSPEATGALDGEGPATNDVAYKLQLPGSAIGEIIIVRGFAYLPTIGAGYRDDLSEWAYWRVDLQNATVEKLFDTPENLVVIGAGADWLLLEDGNEGVILLDVPSGDVRWQANPLADYAALDLDKIDVLLDGDVLYLAWRVQDPFVTQDVIDGIGTGGRGNGGVVALDHATGATIWRWDRPSRGETAANLGPAGPASPVENVGAIRLSAGDGRLFPYVRLSESYNVRESTAGFDSHARVHRYELWALEATTGASLWMQNATEARQVQVEGPAGSIEPLDPELGAIQGATAVITPRAVFLREDQFVARNPATGETIWSSEAGRSDQIHTLGGTAMGTNGEVLIGTTRQTVYRLDPVTGDILWQRTLLEDELAYSVIPVLVSERIAYVPTFQRGTSEGNRVGYEAIDLVTGARRWLWQHNVSVGPTGGFGNFPAHSDGLIVWSGWDGILNVVGTTNASIAPPAVPSGEYPGVGETVTVDLSGGRPGAFGAATRYRADWGDGTLTDWQAEPVLEHAYRAPGDVTARFQVGNDANQTASTFATYHVGAPRPNVISKAFEPDNQDLTFGVLGVLLAVAGGGIGLLRVQRRRNRLTRELEAIEEGFAATRERPNACSAFLDERRARARSLLLDGKLDEGQFHLLEKRVDELSGQVRMAHLEDRFSFLPLGLVRQLERALADGRLSGWERSALLQAVASDATMTAEHKDKVRALVDSWFEGDAEAG